ncbi:retrovirus-related pol polyprotein from transposon TNT 1-94 [Tanacetum coccineum]
MPKSPLKLVDKPSDEGVLVKEPAYNEEESNLQRALELSLKDQGERTQGLARPVVIREPNSRIIQPLPDVQGKGKEKVVDEQATHDVLTLQNPKKKSPANKFIFQRRTLMPTEASGHAESPSLDAELTLTDSEMESDNEARSNPGDAAESQPQSSHVVPAGPNLEHMDFEATDVSTQQKLEQMDEEFTTTTYLNVHENLKLPTEDHFFMEKPQEEEPGKTNAEAEVQSMVLDLIYQDTSSIPLMTTLVIDLTKSQSDSLLPTSTLTISTITTITPTLLPPPPQPQQNTIDPILVKHIDVQNDLYEALQKSLELDYLNQRLANQKEDRKKRRKRRDVPTTPSRSPPSQPPPPPPLAGTSGAPGTSGASGFSQLTLPPPHPSTGTSRSAQQQGNKALSSSKIAASTSQSMAWTTSDTRYESAVVSRAQELSLTDSLMQDDSIPDEQVHFSDNEDSENDHLPKADSRKDWWKPLPKEERSATPEPTWFIPSSNVSAIENNWASVWFQLMNLC